MVLLLGKGVSNDGVELLMMEKKIEYEYLNSNEVFNYDYEYVVKAPGIPYDNEVIINFLNRNVDIYTDIEIGMKFYKDKYYILITGSNGKSTCASLTYHILKNEYKAVLCGNIGYSFCKALVENKNAEVFVVEVSSFQLESANINPNISVILNISPCHLDHHKSFKNYVMSKANITLNQNENNYFIFYNNDVYLNILSKKTKAKIVSFNDESVLAKCYKFNGYVYYENRKIIKISNELSIKKHLLIDYMASISICMIYGIKHRKIKRYIKDFKGLDYRLSKVNEYIYNDSKSTNPYSTISAIKCFDNIILICGGYERNEDLSCLREYLGKIKRVYTYGASKNKVYNFMASNNVLVDICESIEEAFISAIGKRKDEIILFSPMFASYDEFNSYLDRGKYFNLLCEKYLKNENAM